MRDIASCTLTLILFILYLHMGSLLSVMFPVVRHSSEGGGPVILVPLDRSHQSLIVFRLQMYELGAVSCFFDHLMIFWSIHWFRTPTVACCHLSWSAMRVVRRAHLPSGCPGRLALLTQARSEQVWLLLLRFLLSLSSRVTLRTQLDINQ